MTDPAPEPGRALQGDERGLPLQKANPRCSLHGRRGLFRITAAHKDRLTGGQDALQEAPQEPSRRCGANRASF